MKGVVLKHAEIDAHLELAQIPLVDQRGLEELTVHRVGTARPLVLQVARTIMRASAPFEIALTFKMEFLIPFPNLL